MCVTGIELKRFRYGQVGKEEPEQDSQEVPPIVVHTPTAIDVLRFTVIHQDQGRLASPHCHSSWGACRENSFH